LLFFTGEGPGTTGWSLPDPLITFFLSFLRRFTCLSTLLFSLLMAEGDNRAVLAVVGSSGSFVGVLVGVLDGALVLFGVTSAASVDTDGCS